MNARPLMTLPLCGFLALAAPRPCQAVSCSIDNALSATLLLPYFEVDLDNADGITTLFSINNGGSDAVLVNVVLWTDLGIPTLNFPVYLTGYDIQTINVRDIFEGRIPKTASRLQDPGDLYSPKGVFSQDIDHASCTGALPPVDLLPSMVTHIQNAHTGRASAVLGGCAGQNRNDRKARGYVTVDTVNSCQASLPANPAYYDVLTNQNVLWGDFFLVDRAQNSAQGESLVRIEADPQTFGAGKPTFYSRYVAGTGIDRREPLATVWGTRFLNGGPFTGGTELIVWRDTQTVTAPFPCGGTPGLWYPMSQARIWAFDEQENPSDPFPPCYVTTCPPLVYPPPFPLATNRVAVGAAGSDLSTPFSFGWMFLDLKSGPGPRPQAWVGTLMSASGRFSVGYEATPFDSACQPITVVFPQ